MAAAESVSSDSTPPISSSAPARPVTVGPSVALVHDPVLLWGRSVPIKTDDVLNVIVAEEGRRNAVPGSIKDLKSTFLKTFREELPLEELLGVGYSGALVLLVGKCLMASTSKVIFTEHGDQIRWCPA
jgi:hypothetical protein